MQITGGVLSPEEIGDLGAAVLGSARRRYGQPGGLVEVHLERIEHQRQSRVAVDHHQCLHGGLGAEGAVDAIEEWWGDPAGGDQLGGQVQHRQLGGGEIAGLPAGFGDDGVDGGGVEADGACHVPVLAELVGAVHRRCGAQHDEFAQPSRQHRAAQRGVAGDHPAGEHLLGVGECAVDVEIAAARGQFAGSGGHLFGPAVRDSGHVGASMSRSVALRTNARP